MRRSEREKSMTLYDICYITNEGHKKIVDTVEADEVDPTPTGFILKRDGNIVYIFNGGLVASARQKPTSSEMFQIDLEQAHERELDNRIRKMLTYMDNI